MKESIIDNHNAALRGYRYALDVGTMMPALGEDGQITLYAPDGENVVSGSCEEYCVAQGTVLCVDTSAPL